MKEAMETDSNPMYKKVRGWLLFLVLTLTIFGPLATIGRLPAAYNELRPLFGKISGFFIVAIIDFTLSLGLVGYSIYAGVSLWRIRSNAVRIAKTFLLCGSAYTIVAAFLPFFAGFPDAVANVVFREIGKESIGSVIGFVIWYLYLSRSKRVANTYASPTRET